MVDVKDRRGRAGSSDIATILGIQVPGRKLTPYGLWEIITGRREPEVFDDERGPAYWGTRMEPVIVPEYELDTGRQVEPGGEWKHRELDYLIVHPDRIVRVGDRLRPLEMKTGWGENSQHWKLGVPKYHIPQAVAHMACIPRSLDIDFAALCRFGAWFVYTVPRRAGLEELILERVDEWWQQHVVKDDPPAPINLEDAKRRWEIHRAGRYVTASPERVVQLKRAAEIRRQIKQLEDEKDDLDFRFRAALQTGEGYVSEAGEELATCRTALGFDEDWLRRNHPEVWNKFLEQAFDLKAFKAAHPKLYREAKRLPGNRTLLIKGTEEDE